MHRILLLLVALAGLAQSVRAVTFTIALAAVSNTYNGTITLLVNGLTVSGDTVIA